LPCAFAWFRDDWCSSSNSGLSSEPFLARDGRNFEKPARAPPEPVSAETTLSTFPNLAIKFAIWVPAASENDGLSHTSCRILSMPSCSPSRLRTGEYAARRRGWVSTVAPSLKIGIRGTSDHRNQVEELPQLRNSLNFGAKPRSRAGYLSVLRVFG